MKYQFGRLKCMKREIIVAIIILSIFLLNYYTPYYADDYNYMYSFALGERITNIRDIVPSMVAHYESMNGRIVLHFLAQLFLIFPLLFLM